MSFQLKNRRYTGSKLKIIDWIDSIISKNCKKCLSFCDIFAGTGIVAEKELNRFNKIIINDFLSSNNFIYNAFFLNHQYDEKKIYKYFIKYHTLNVSNLSSNYVSKNFGNKFFSLKDAKKIGYIREDIENNKNELNVKEYSILLASLLYSLDRCANTCGHYEAYIKKPIKKDTFNFELIKPCNVTNKKIEIYCQDANALATNIKADVVYIDPPYSSRQYSRFYHVLENIAEWKKPKLYGEAMKPIPEKMSEYCKTKAIDFFSALIMSLETKFIIVSYNNTYNSKSKSSENRMLLDEIKAVLEKRGKTKVYKIKHPAYNAGKTNLEDHKEVLFVTEVCNDD